MPSRGVLVGAPGRRRSSARGAGDRSAGASAAPSSWRGASLLVLDGCWASRGKIQHNDLPLLLVGGGARRRAGGRPVDRRAAGAGVGLAGAHEHRRRHRHLLPHRVPEGRGERAGVGAQRQPPQRDVRRRRSPARRPPTRCRCFIADRPLARPRASRSSRSSSSSARSSRSCWPRTRVAYVVAVAVPPRRRLPHPRPRLLDVGRHRGDRAHRLARRAPAPVDARPRRGRRRTLTPSRHRSTTRSTPRPDTSPSWRPPWGLLDDPELVAAAAAATDEARDRPAAARVVPVARRRHRVAHRRPPDPPAGQGHAAGSAPRRDRRRQGGGAGGARRRAGARPGRGAGAARAGRAGPAPPAAGRAGRSAGLREPGQRRPVDPHRPPPDAARAHRGGRAAHHRPAAASG